jgi:hypothetical protein
LQICNSFNPQNKVVVDVRAIVSNLTLQQSALSVEPSFLIDFGKCTVNATYSWILTLKNISQYAFDVLLKSKDHPEVTFHLRQPLFVTRALTSSSRFQPITDGHHEVKREQALEKGASSRDNMISELYLSAGRSVEVELRYRPEISSLPRDQRAYMLNTRNFFIPLQCRRPEGVTYDWRALEIKSQICLSQLNVSLRSIDFGECIVGETVTKTFEVCLCKLSLSSIHTI